ncbi:hypothetical protein HQ535_03350 [bacterium]|nr:hypothetical protein [bacterium]
MASRVVGPPFLCKPERASGPTFPRREPRRLRIAQTAIIAAAAWSVARVWDEAVLDAIRRDFPAPTVHARSLFYASAAMWDAWVGYDDDGAVGYFVDESLDASDVEDDGGDEQSLEDPDRLVFRVMVHRERSALVLGSGSVDSPQNQGTGCRATTSITRSTETTSSSWKSPSTPVKR